VIINFDRAILSSLSLSLARSGEWERAEFEMSELAVGRDSGSKFQLNFSLAESGSNFGMVSIGDEIGEQSNTRRISSFNASLDWT